MKNSIISASSLFAAFTIAGCSSGSIKAEASHQQNQARTIASESPCPSDIIKPFAGRYDGLGLLISAQGSQQQIASKDEFKAIDCNSFGITVNYLNDSQMVTRTIDLVATHDPVDPAGVFVFEGWVTEGSAKNKMTGTFRQIQDGTLLGTFSGALGGKVAYFTELMNVTSSNGVRQIVRGIQIFAGEQGGPYLASRVTIETQSKD